MRLWPQQRYVTAETADRRQRWDVDLKLDIQPGQTAMKTAKLLINILAFSALFFDYAVAMQPPQPAGTRRYLSDAQAGVGTGLSPE